MGVLPRLTEAESFVLEWLSKEDDSALGECHGRALDRLFELGLAHISTPAPEGVDRLYARVSLTESGKLAVMREA